MHKSCCLSQVSQRNSFTISVQRTLKRSYSFLPHPVAFNTSPLPLIRGSMADLERKGEGSVGRKIKSPSLMWYACTLKKSRGTSCALMARRLGAYTFTTGSLTLPGKRQPFLFAGGIGQHTPAHTSPHFSTSSHSKPPEKYRADYNNFGQVPVSFICRKCSRRSRGLASRISETYTLISR